jgi:nucleoside-diphosphate-sugar epimerase
LVNKVIEITMATHLVTGVAGFIGSHIAETLLLQGEKVIGIDQFNDYYDLSLKRKNAIDLEKYANFQLIEADIQAIDWQPILKDISVIYHQAAQAGVRASWGASFSQYTERNINATQILLEAAKEVPSLQRFVYASTSSVYGDAETMPTPETVCPEPVSPYGITKLAAERLCYLYHQNFGVPIVALRYFSVFGPRQRPDMAFHKFFKAAIAKQPINIYGDGQQTRDFTFVSDVVAANLSAAVVPDAVGEVFNVGGGSRIVLTDILDCVDRVIGDPIQRNYIEKAIGDARHTSADVTKARKILNYSPKVSMLEGLTKEWEWIQGVYS